MVELASMLSGVPFSDRPQSVCPVLREFLHGYNDQLPDELRQDLYAVASAIVSTRAPAPVMAWRGRLIIDWAQSLASIEDISIPYRGWTLADCGLAGRAVGTLAAHRRWFHDQTVAFLTWLALRHERQQGRHPDALLRPADPRPSRAGAGLDPAAVLGPADCLAPVASVELLHH